MADFDFLNPEQSDQEPYGGTRPVPPQHPTMGLPPVQQQVDIPFTQSDSLYLQRLQSGLSEINKRLDAGEIYPHEHQELSAQILPRMQALQQRQQKAQSVAQQAAKAALLDQTATQEAVRGVHLQKVMDELPGLVRHVVDPISGAAESYVPLPDGKGGWKIEPVEYKHHHATLDRMEGASATEGALPEETGGQAVYNIRDQQGQPAQTLEQFGQEQRQKAGLVQAPLPRILNAAGEDITAQQQEAYDRFKRTGSWAPQGQAGSDEHMLSEQEIAEMYRRAQRQVPRPINPNDPHQVLHYQDQIRELVRAQVEHKHDIAKIKQYRAAQSDEAQRHEKAQHAIRTQERQDKLQEQRAARGELPSTPAQRTARMMDFYRDLVHDRDRRQKEINDPLKTEEERDLLRQQMPAYLRDRQSMMDEAGRSEQEWENELTRKRGGQVHPDDEQKAGGKNPSRPGNKPLVPNPGRDYRTGKGLVPEAARNMMSSVSLKQVREKMALAHQLMGQVMKDPTNLGAEGVGENVDQMLSTLLAAHKENRGLTIGERAFYRGALERLQSIMTEREQRQKEPGWRNKLGALLGNSQGSGGGPSVLDDLVLKTEE